MPHRYWHFAFETAVYLINRLPSPTIDNHTPFFLLYRSHTDYKFLKYFGCLVYPLTRPYNAHKFSYRSVSCAFLGYPSNFHGYRCLDIKSGRIYIARHLTFVEDCFPFAAQPKPITSPTSISPPLFSIPFSFPPSNPSSAHHRFHHCLLFTFFNLC